MKKLLSFFTLSILLFSLLSIPVAFAKKKPKKALSKKITITSESFARNERMPLKFAYGGYISGGDNVSPHLAWKTKRRDIQSYSLLFWDKHPIAEKSVHWCVIDIPSTLNSLPEGASGTNMPEGSVELTNVAGFTGYVGPYPPEGSGPHEYEFFLVGLKVEKLGLTDCTVDSFKRAIKRKTLAKGKYVGKFEAK